MSIDMGVLLAVIGGFATIVSLLRSKKQDVSSDVAQMTTVIVKLENIASGISDIKSEITSIKKEQNEDHDRIMRLEEKMNVLFCDRERGKDEK